MASIYDFNVALSTINLLPPNKRNRKILAYLGVFGTELQYMHDIIVGTYIDGFQGNIWDNTSTYAKGMQVRFSDQGYAATPADNSVYEALKAVPANTPPTITNIGIYWIRIQNIWIGARERAKYNEQNIILELILNKYFNVPPYSFPFTGASHSTQIYISKSAGVNNSMFMAQDSMQSKSWMAQNSKFAKSFMPQISSAANQILFTINVPAAVKTKIENSMVGTITVSPNDTNNYKTIITSLVNKYVRAGKIYSITTY